MCVLLQQVYCDFGFIHLCCMCCVFVHSIDFYFGGTQSSKQDGDTALTLAASNGHADCVRLLIDVGANKEAKDIVRTILSLHLCVLTLSFGFTLGWQRLHV